MRIPVSRPSLKEEEITAIKKVFETGWLGLGSTVFEFERGLKEYLGAKYVIACNTGTSALHLALDGFGVKRGDEVLVSSLTFVATIQAILMCGATPVFCDVEEDTLNIDVTDVERKITKRSRVIMPVHYSGLVCDMERLMDIAKRKGLLVIEDAAHAFGSTYRGRKIGTIGDAVCFSFDPIKVITCGEGGAVVTNNKKIAEIMVKKRVLGIDKDSWSRQRNRRSWFYQVNTTGFRYHMSNFNASIGLAQFAKLDKFLSRRREIARQYDTKLIQLADIKLIKKDYNEVAPFNYIIKVRHKKRAALMKYLKKQGIETGIHYIPNHLHPLFSRYNTDLPVTNKIWKEILTLPLYSEMADAEVKKVVKAIKDFFVNKVEKCQNLAS